MGTAPDLKADGAGRRVAIVAASFNESITAEMVAGARRALLVAGVAESDVHEIRVPGAFEIAPTIRQVLAYGPEVDAIVALGAVIRGETPHFDVLSHAVSHSLQSLANEINVPLTFGVLTTDSVEQATKRADSTGLDKGGEAARAALAQVEAYERIRERGETRLRGFRVP
ncbi:MAG: 6,7-dimethyl-8-ribityllumazine synthase [Gemmatimonadetes bacterium]|nr:6,7-dimethyl-8-ribityllumazine synthase [Gemmatimonadota bacterium]